MLMPQTLVRIGEIIDHAHVNRVDINANGSNATGSHDPVNVWHGAPAVPKQACCEYETSGDGGIESCLGYRPCFLCVPLRTVEVEVVGQWIGQCTDESSDGNRKLDETSPPDSETVILGKVLGYGR